MPSTKDIKRRQHSVKNTQQVTRAMEMVAASKMRKAQLVALGSRPYSRKALSILSHIKLSKPGIKNIFLDKNISPRLIRPGREKSNTLLAVVVTSDKGLAGGLNSSVIREASKVFEQYKKDGFDIKLVLSGAKSKSYFERMGFDILEVFKGVGDYITLDEAKPISSFIQKKYKEGSFNETIIIYTEFISTLKQKVAVRQLLPISEDNFTDIILDAGNADRDKDTESEIKQAEYIFEPNAAEVLKNLIPFLIDIYIYHVILESNASEHSARMVAMRNASDNAENMLEELTLTYNKARQSAVTREITEISAGVEALK